MLSDNREKLIERVEGEIRAEEQEEDDLKRLERETHERIELHKHELRRLRDEGHYHLEVVVNGTSIAVRTDPAAPLERVIVEALEKSENTGQPPSQWTLRNERGDVLSPSRSAESYGLASGAKVFLSLNAGVGGDR